jgi:hypothetical protein
MNTLTKTRTTFPATVATLAALAALAWHDPARAIEPGSSDPHLPGITDGLPGGALPPPGVYATNDVAYLSGSLQDGNGNAVKGAAATNITAFVNEPVLLWSTPLHFLDAQYAVALVQPIATISVTTGGVTTNKTGITNTVLVPAILSWHLPLGFFVAGSVPIYLQDGDTGDRGNGTSSQQHVANNTTTFGPALALSWFNGKGLSVSINGEYDIQTRNDNFVNNALAHVSYQSGDILNLDYTVQQKFGAWQFGVVGYYAVQTTDDQTTTSIPALGINNSTATVPANFANLQNGVGNRFEKFAIGPLVQYDFGPALVNFRYTQDVYTKNATQNGTFWFRIGFPL